MARGFKPVEADLSWPEPRQWGDIVQISYGKDTDWVLVAEYETAGGSVWIIVWRPISYRAHDEQELVHYWTQKASEEAPIAIAYEIAESAYLEELRLGMSAVAQAPLHHFLICGENLCLEAIASDPPMVSRVRPTIRDGHFSLEG